MSIFDRIAKTLLGESYRRLEAEAQAYQEAYKRLPALMHPGSSLFQEMDDQYVQLLAQFTSQYDILYGQAPTTGIFRPTEQQRLQAVYRSRKAWLIDPITDSIIRNWLNFAFGTTIDVVPRDDTKTPQTIFTAKKCWDEYFRADRNRYVYGTEYIGEINNSMLTDGEIFFLNFTYTDTGLTTTTIITTEEIPVNGIIYDPDDRRKPLYYHRQYTDQNGNLGDIYYPDWKASREDLSRATLPTGAVVFYRPGIKAQIKWASFNRRFGRGWPLMTSGLDWTLAYKDNLQDQATVAKLVAMIVNKLTVKGGSRAVQAQKSQYESTLVNSGYFLDRNPPAVAGSTFIGNEQVSLDRMPLTTGARDNAVTSASLLAMGLNAGGNQPLDWFGRGDVNTYAQANSANIPAFRNFNRYQIFWASVWSDLAELVLSEYKASNPEADYHTYAVDVSQDALLQPSITDITGAVASIYRDTIIPLIEAGQLPPPLAQNLIIKTLQIALQAFGIKDVADVIDSEDFTPDEEIRRAVENLREGKIQPEQLVDFIIAGQNGRY